MLDHGDDGAAAGAQLLATPVIVEALLGLDLDQLWKEFVLR
jgi:hypothetical protein